MPTSQRDYLHARRDGEDHVLRFRPAPKQLPLWCMVLCIGVVLFALVGAVQWWQGKQLQSQPLQPTPSSAPAHSAPSSAPQAASGGVSLDAPPSATQSSAGTVTKCVVNGRVSYTDAACPAGAQSVHVKLAPANVMQAVPVSPTLSPPDAVPPTPQQPSGIDAAPTPVAQPMPPVVSKDLQCKALSEQVRQLDLITLQPLTPPILDYYRGVRRRLRDQQFALGC